MKTFVWIVVSSNNQISQKSRETC